MSLSLPLPCALLLIDLQLPIDADLGWNIALIEDACFTVDHSLHDGRVIAAADMHERMLALLDGEYAQILSTAHTLAWLETEASHAP